MKNAKSVERLKMAFFLKLFKILIFIKEIAVVLFYYNYNFLQKKRIDLQYVISCN